MEAAPRTQMAQILTHSSMLKALAEKEIAAEAERQHKASLPWNIEGISKKAYDARMKKKKEEDKAAKGRQKAEDKAAREAIKEAESAAREAEKATKALQKSQALPLKKKKKRVLVVAPQPAAPVIQRDAGKRPVTLKRRFE